MITDEALMAFVLWARNNPHSTVTDPVVLRRVFTAYEQMEPLEPAGGARISLNANINAEHREAP